MFSNPAQKGRLPLEYAWVQFSRKEQPTKVSLVGVRHVDDFLWDEVWKSKEIYGLPHSVRPAELQLWTGNDVLDRNVNLEPFTCDTKWGSYEHPYTVKTGAGEFFLEHASERGLEEEEKEKKKE